VTYRLNHFLAAFGVAVLTTLSSLPWPWLVLALVGSVVLVPAAWRGQE